MMAVQRRYYLSEDLAGDATAGLTLLPYTGTDFHVPVKSYVSRIIALLTEAATAGTAKVHSKKNGSQNSTAWLTLSTTVPRLAEVALDMDDIALEVGDRLGFEAVTVSFTPTSSDLLVICELTPRA
jgi:hypothetical protein